ncbi:Retrotransposon-derived protein peg10 [Entomophthora muscae]|uniref:Retrotransposon-derived protein peg10 n=1 Tax=Entomophthora muscae TaxID=34485 RepID=A0ACC2TF19_9FUNG|nr:Retrotransposon-derived protein peg10 [Entomophthora muscae]
MVDTRPARSLNLPGFLPKKEQWELVNLQVHRNLPEKLEPLIREVVKWNQKYLSSKTPPSSNLSPAARLFVPDKVPLPSNPPPGTEPKSGGGFCLTAKEVLRRRNNNLCSYCGSKDHLLPACPLSKRSLFTNKTSTLTLLSLIGTSKSSTVLVTIHGPLGKIKVLALLDTGADANFIEEKLAKLIGLSASRSLDVKVGNSTVIGATPILQPVTIDLEGSPFCVTCNSSPNLSFPFILGFPWLRESLLNFDHPNNKISFTCNDVVKFLPLVSGSLCLIPSKLNLTTISSTILDTLSSKDKDGYCVWLQGTTSWRTQQEIFITKDLRFKASLGLALRAKLRAHTLISWKTRYKGPFGRKDRKILKIIKANTNVDKLVFIRSNDSILNS